ncbi:NADH-quinone oxidoreductase subunit NuoN [Limobrevibacterium gyesilva]|uniref:NADH-quinone oxidoreductase subunit N n=1 Tax=Limobrevibacterium gyesilva TaxID=2991712 RepID=A0AA41YRD3_9PROT|nr:NADH-quinone oxidoreductase subunit NuoN [Limobrevibacterium gyesilva]MCW3475208.1 NADH-quinone oxidoreductase subunit NuoN [Limobrevibacterium gyesilva]
MNWTLAVPELVLACCGMGILVFGVLSKRETFQLCSMLTIGAFLLTGVLVLPGAYGVGYSGLFTSDAFSAFVKLLVLVAAALCVVVSLDYNEHVNLRRFEFPVLMLFCTVGMMLMASASNLMTMYVGTELMSLAIYVLAAFARDELRSAEAGLKYFVLGALASGLMLYGISLVYGFSGSMAFDKLAEALADPASASPGLVVGIVFIVAGLAFKVSAVPFHMWTPDVYEGAPTSITAFLGTAPKVAPMALLVRAMATPFGQLLVQWQQLIVLVSIASMLLGSLAAIGQRNIKRLMAYSSIGHMGYVLIGLAAGSVDGIRGVLIYLVTYVFMNVGTFACILAMRRRGKMLEGISDLAGLGRTDPAMALAFAVFMFGMAGIPPLSGFWGKYFIFSAAVQQGMWTLAVIGVLTSVVGAYYYINIVKVMYFDAPEEAFDPRPASLSFVAAVGGLFTTFFFVFPAPVVAAAEAAAKVLFR